MASDDHNKGEWVNPRRRYLVSPRRRNQDNNKILWFKLHRPTTLPIRCPLASPLPPDGGWITPHRPLTPSFPLLEVTVGRGKLKSSDGGWITPNLPLVDPIFWDSEPAGDGKEISPDATPTTMMMTSGVSPDELKSGQLCSIDPTWIYKSMMEHIRKGEEGLGTVESESFPDLVTLYFPWEIAGETWEDAKAEAERWLKEQDLSCLQGLDDEDLPSSDEIKSTQMNVSLVVGRREYIVW